jgi:hypothetical protein
MVPEVVKLPTIFGPGAKVMVGRCRFTASKPEFKARMVSVSAIRVLA